MRYIVGAETCGGVSLPQALKVLLAGLSSMTLQTHMHYPV